MIVRMTGTVTDVDAGRVIVERDGLAREVLVCGYAEGELRACLGRQITLHTLEYLEASNVGGNLTPRLVGFLRSEDRAFFQRFITVKNLGTRKALKALIEPVGAIAAAIESSDVAALSRLPGIGKRGAETIVAELRGKVTSFAIEGLQKTERKPVADGWSAAQRDALEVMIALGERKADAHQWLERAFQLHPGDRGADDWVKLAYRVRSGSES